MMNLKLFPWDKDEKPFWVNPENGLLWYVDKYVTEWCTKEKLGWPKLDAVCFYVCQKIGDKIDLMTRILLDKKTNEILAEDQSLESMAVKIEAMRMAKKK